MLRSSPESECGSSSVQLRVLGPCAPLLSTLDRDWTSAHPFLRTKIPTSGFLHPETRSRSKSAQDLNGFSGFPARFERSERYEQFGHFFFGKTAQTAQILL